MHLPCRRRRGALPVSAALDPRACGAGKPSERGELQATHALAAPPSRAPTQPAASKDVKFAPVDGNEATARVAYAVSDVSFIYPITPATPMGEHTCAAALKAWATCPASPPQQPPVCTRFAGQLSDSLNCPPLRPLGSPAPWPLPAGEFVDQWSAEKRKNLYGNVMSVRCLPRLSKRCSARSCGCWHTAVQVPLQLPSGGRKRPSPDPTGALLPGPCLPSSL